MESTDVFVLAGPNPRMRFKRIQCPIVEIMEGTDPLAVREALDRGASPEPFGPRCKEEIIVFFKNIAFCPVHGLMLTKEPWTEGNGGQA